MDATSPAEDGESLSRRYCEMVGWTRGDPSQRLWWFAADAVLAALFTWITVVSLQSAATSISTAPSKERAGCWRWPQRAAVGAPRCPSDRTGVATALYLAASAAGRQQCPLAIPFFALFGGRHPTDPGVRFDRRRCRLGAVGDVLRPGDRIPW